MRLVVIANINTFILTNGPRICKILTLKETRWRAHGNSKLSFEIFCKYKMIPHLKVHLKRQNIVSDIRQPSQMENQSITQEKEKQGGSKCMSVVSELRRHKFKGSAGAYDLPVNCA